MNDRKILTIRAVDAYHTAMQRNVKKKELGLTISHPHKAFTYAKPSINGIYTFVDATARTYTL